MFNVLHYHFVRNPQVRNLLIINLKRKRELSYVDHSFLLFGIAVLLEFPEEIYDEINQPDIKMLFEVMMKVIFV